MELLRLWYSLRSWMTKPRHLWPKESSTGSEDSRQDDRGVDGFGSAPETAIFDKESGVGSQRVWLRQAFLDDVCLQDQIKEAVDRA
ncbi:MAG TPA: hypothetical protein VNX28_01645, partial [Gemmataceae bacterium]|nr:hypothetical protein [Gemmataceae bacterium]